MGGCFYLITQIISGDYSKTPFRDAILGLSLYTEIMKLCQGLVLDKGYYSDNISIN